MRILLVNYNYSKCYYDLKIRKIGHCRSSFIKVHTKAVINWNVKLNRKFFNFITIGKRFHPITFLFDLLWNFCNWTYAFLKAMSNFCYSFILYICTLCKVWRQKHTKQLQKTEKKIRGLDLHQIVAYATTRPLQRLTERWLSDGWANYAMTLPLQRLTESMTQWLLGILCNDSASEKTHWAMTQWL